MRNLFSWESRRRVNDATWQHAEKASSTQTFVFRFLLHGKLHQVICYFSIYFVLLVHFAMTWISTSHLSHREDSHFLFYYKSISGFYDIWQALLYLHMCFSSLFSINQLWISNTGTFTFSAAIFTKVSSRIYVCKAANNKLNIGLISSCLYIFILILLSCRTAKDTADFKTGHWSKGACAFKCIALLRRN